MASGKKGKLFVVTGPSGVGKGTVLKKFFKNNENVHFSVSMTTRKRRPGELEGVNYFFVSKEEFDLAVRNGELLEWTEYSGNFYGTNKNYVKKELEKGNDVLLEIETNGACRVMEIFKDCVTIFFAPPSLEELEARLRGRNTEDEEAIQRRLGIVRYELSTAGKFQYTIVNDEVETAYNKLQAVYDFESKKDE